MNAAQFKACLLALSIRCYIIMQIRNLLSITFSFIFSSLAFMTVNISVYLEYILLDLFSPNACPISFFPEKKNEPFPDAFK